MRRTDRLSLVVVVIAVAACSDVAANLPVGVASYTGPAGNDTTQAAPSRVVVTGRVLGVSAIVPTPPSNDSVRFDPVSRARLRIMRNVLVNGQASQVLAVELVTNDAGQYTVKDLPGGYYIIYAYPPSGSAYNDNWAYLPALQTEVKVDVYLWKKQ